MKYFLGYYVIMYTLIALLIMFGPFFGIEIYQAKPNSIICMTAPILLLMWWTKKDD